MAIGVPNFGRQQRSPIETVMMLERHRRLEEQGEGGGGILGGGLDMIRGFQQAGMFSPSMGERATQATVGDFGVSMPREAKVNMGLPSSDEILGPLG